MFLKRCRICKIEKKIEEFHKSNKTHRTECKKCSGILKNNNSKSKEFLLRTLLSTARSTAKHRKEKRPEAGEFNLTFNDLNDIWVEQDGRCYYTGIIMSYESHSDYKCSLERLDNDKGYIKSNVVFVILELNNPCQITVDKLKYIFTIDITLKHPLIEEILDMKLDLEFRNKQQKNKSRITNNIIEYECQYCYIFKTLDKFKKTRLTCCRDCINKSLDNPRSRLITILGGTLSSTTVRNKRNRIKLEHNITFEDMKQQLVLQKGKCFYSGMNMSFQSGENWFISIERLDVNLGYIKGNIVFVCHEFNSSDKTSMISPYARTGSCGITTYKFDFIRQSTLEFNNFYRSSNEIVTNSLL